MASIEEIDKAIAAHGMWKARLKAAIETAKLDTSVETVRQDNQCAFEMAVRSHAHACRQDFETLRDRERPPRRVPQTAAHVMELALGGKKPEAEAMLAFGGEYAAVSAKLTQAMMEWKKVSK